MQGLPSAPLPMGQPWPVPAQQLQQPLQLGSPLGSSPSHMSGLIQAASQLGLPLPHVRQTSTGKPSSAPSALCMLLSDNGSNGSGSSPEKSSEAKDRSSPEKTGDDEYRRMRRRLTNRESAQRVRHKGKESLQVAVSQARVLAEETCRLQQAQTQSTTLVQQLQGELNQWRIQAHDYASENRNLKRRLASCEQQLEAAQKRAYGMPHCSAVELPDVTLACTMPSDSFMMSGPQLVCGLPLPQVSSAACDPFASSLALPALGQAGPPVLDLTVDVGLPKDLTCPFYDWSDLLQHDFPL